MSRYQPSRTAPRRGSAHVCSFPGQGCCLAPAPWPGPATAATRTPQPSAKSQPTGLSFLHRHHKKQRVAPRESSRPAPAPCRAEGDLIPVTKPTGRQEPSVGTRRGRALARSPRRNRPLPGLGIPAAPRGPPKPRAGLQSRVRVQQWMFWAFVHPSPGVGEGWLSRALYPADLPEPPGTSQRKEQEFLRCSWGAGARAGEVARVATEGDSPRPEGEDGEGGR